MTSTAAPPQVRYSVAWSRDGWELAETTMPESMLHDAAVALVKAVLDAWVVRAAVTAKVVRNLAVRWDSQRPAVGVDPDVAVLAPPPPDDGIGRSVRTWIDGHTAPILAIEVVSDSDPHKDYQAAPEKYAASGTSELWVFDPLLCGPTSHGGPYRLQVWRRDPDGALARIYAGDGPAYSPALDAHAVVVEGGRRLRIASDAHGAALWPTAEEAERAAKETERAAKEAERVAKEAERAAKEAERAAKEAERAAKEAERVAKDAALARVAELERELATRRDG